MIVRPAFCIRSFASMSRVVRFLFVFAVALMPIAPVGIAWAAVPTNDNFANAIPITSLPFNAVLNTTEATTEPGEPQVCGSLVGTVWYQLAPTATAMFTADTHGSASAAHLVVYRADSAAFGGLMPLGCATSLMTFVGQAGTQYYIQVGSWNSGGDVHLNLATVPPPANDNFASATSFSAVPFTDTIDLRSASLESGEPRATCAIPYSVDSSVWYAFTPSGNGSITAGAEWPSFTGVYTGSSLNTLTEAACRVGSPATFSVTAGQKYYLQVGGVYGYRSSITLNVYETPPPQANFFASPFDPSIFDNVQFFEQSFDPAGVGIQSRSWLFGDGSTATGQNPSHRYAADGEYTVTLMITTSDGRSASTSQTIPVRTHDVAISRFSVPTNGRTGQTREITVNVTNKRLPETVQVQLFKSAPGGYELVGTLTQAVRVGTDRGTPFSFNYTFTSQDALVGKVTFRTMATVLGARDALAADNEAIASPTTVNR
jgi:PKD repeat protein